MGGWSAEVPSCCLRRMPRVPGTWGNVFNLGLSFGRSYARCGCEHANSYRSGRASCQPRGDKRAWSFEEWWNMSGYVGVWAAGCIQSEGGGQEAGNAGAQGETASAFPPVSGER